jgi:hypothetical protein
MIFPILISVLVAPTSYRFAATATPADIITATADIAAARQNMGRILLLLVVVPSKAKVR